ncbi:aminodeoxychorismate lyase [uncultured Corynebacterium sp.]|uniref:aminodeoxychorismate lyase n=1 Tax=uncultured Corynebacterium sp. TaxID=159447 RepID=UPI0025DFE170|nr:aminodeoxychorismate lyase [uncultured Corynebacterium sp.]
MTVHDRRIVLVDVLPDSGPRVADADEPFLHPDDLGAVRGDGVFETLLVRDGRACNAARHEDRFLSSAAMLQLPAPDLDQWREATRVALDEWATLDGGTFAEADAAMRWVYSRGRESTGKPTGYIMVAPAAGNAEIRARGVGVMLAERGFSLDLGNRAPWALIGAKTLSYAANMAALRHAKAHGFDDVIFTSAEGNLLEGPTSTIVLVRGRELLTPNPGEGVLPGTTQAALFDLAAEKGWTCVPAQLTPADLRAADSVWLVSSVRIAVRVTSLDGEELPSPGDDAVAEFRALCDEALAR